ncbi:MAG TPA: hypothetical protein VFD03_09780 [Clostridia bacterium]|nr:hypothetical protein [Clostridia bacterium]
MIKLNTGTKNGLRIMFELLLQIEKYNDYAEFSNCVDILAESLKATYEVEESKNVNNGKKLS